MTVNSSSNYQKDDTFEPEATIVVKYSSNDRLNASEVFENWKTLKYQELVKALKDKGFTNVSTTEIETEKKDKDNLVDTITVSGNTYSVGDCYVQKATPITIDYLRYKISTG